MFVAAMSFFSCNGLKCVSMNNQECKIRNKSEIININSNDLLFYPYSVNMNMCSGSCNNINNLCEKLCIPDLTKDINVKGFNLMLTNNETRHIEWHETCQSKCRLDACVCNNKQRWNEGKCRCECNDLIDKEICDKGFIWNPSNCDCECDKSRDVRECLDHKNCKCRKWLIDKLVGKSTGKTDEKKITLNSKWLWKNM